MEVIAFLNKPAERLSPYNRGLTFSDVFSEVILWPPLALLLILLLRIFIVGGDYMTNDSPEYVNGDFTRQPFYIFFLSLSRFIFGHFYVTFVIAFQAFLGSLTALLVTFLLARHLPLTRWSLVLIQFWILSPYFTFGTYPLQIMTEGLLYPLFWLVLVFSVIGYFFNRAKYVYVSFALFFVGFLTKFYFAILLPVIFSVCGLVFIVDLRKGRRRMWRLAQLIVPILMLMVGGQIDKQKNLVYNGFFVSSSYTGLALLPVAIYATDGRIDPQTSEPVRKMLRHVAAEARAKGCTQSSSHYSPTTTWVPTNAVDAAHYDPCYTNIGHRILTSEDLSQYLPNLPKDARYQTAPIQIRSALDREVTQAVLAVFRSEPASILRQVKVNLSRGHTRGGQLILVMIVVSCLLGFAGFLATGSFPFLALYASSLTAAVNLCALSVLIFLHGRLTTITDTIFLATISVLLLETYINREAWLDHDKDRRAANTMRKTQGW